ncbi:hypothetical protein KC366_g17323 [Hortaea werneckii]|nr:hypothetical protein KC366_g17323 [Hortaea werneckii]
MGKHEAGSDGGGGSRGQREVEGSEKKGGEKMEGNFLDRLLLRFLLLQTQSSTQPERENIQNRGGASHEGTHLSPNPLPQPRPHFPPPTPPPTHLPTLPTLLITLLSLTKHIPLILCTSAPGNEILRWFIHLPAYAGWIIFMHGVWSLGAVVGVWEAVSEA